MDLTPEQTRVLAALMEKAATTPDQYPLTTNALVSACNQRTSRDPVVEYTERQVDAVMLELRERKLARTVSGSGHRVGKHKHVVDEALGLDPAALAVLAVLLLRGAQTRNELTSRTERYADGPGGDPCAVDAAIDRLVAHDPPLAVRLERRPGEREPRIDQCWTSTRVAGEPGDPVAAPATPATDGFPTGTTPPTTTATVADRATATVPADPALGGPPGAVTPASSPAPALESRVAELERALAEQTRRIDDLLDRLGG